MNLSDYQDWVESVSTERVNTLGINYAALGLAGETGEVVERVKKIIRDRDGVATKDDIEYIRLELGDILWYIAKFCNELDLTLEEVFQANVEKINDRRVNGKK